MTNANVDQSFRLDGQTAAITGAATGIGFAIAERFLAAGARVLIADLDAEAAEGAVGRLGGNGVASTQCDVSEDAAGDAIVERAVAEFGSLDILVNNAGIFPSVPIREIEPSLLDRLLGVNVRGMVLCSKAAANRMVEQGSGGSIINLASVASFRPSAPGLAAYSTSKGAVLQFTRGLALELGPHGIRVNAVAPGGGLMTEGNRKLSERRGETPEQWLAARNERIRHNPIARGATPEDMANAALFLASSAAGFIAGETIVVDGGSLLR